MLTSDDLDGERLYEESAVLTQEGPGWQVVRLTASPDLWLVDQEEDGYTAWLHVPFHVEPIGEEYAFVVGAAKFGDWEDPFVQSKAVDKGNPLWISMGRLCTGACGVFNETAEMVFLVGSESTGGRLHFGFTEETRIEEAEALVERPPITLAPDATGEHGHAGSITSFRSGTEKEHTVVGRLDHTQSDLLSLPGELQARHETTAVGQAPESGAGTGGVTMGLREGAGATQWDLQWRFGADEATMDDLVVWTGVPAAGTTNHRSAFTTGPGDAEIKLELKQSVFTPTTLPPVAVLDVTHRLDLSWWHADVDLEALHGWNLPSLASGVAQSENDSDQTSMVYFCDGRSDPCDDMETRLLPGTV